LSAVRYRPNLHVAELEFWTPEWGWAAEPGGFQVFVGPNSCDLQMLTFELTN